jgi:hypothetical protein
METQEGLRMESTSTSARPPKHAAQSTHAAEGEEGADTGGPGDNPRQVPVAVEGNDQHPEHEPGQAAHARDHGDA